MAAVRFIEGTSFADRRSMELTPSARPMIDGMTKMNINNKPNACSDTLSVTMLRNAPAIIAPITSVHQTASAKEPMSIFFLLGLIVVRVVVAQDGQM